MFSEVFPDSAVLFLDLSSLVGGLGSDAPPPAEAMDTVELVSPAVDAFAAAVLEGLPCCGWGWGVSEEVVVSNDGQRVGFGFSC